MTTVQISINYTSISFATEIKSGIDTIASATTYSYVSDDGGDPLRFYNYIGTTFQDFSRNVGNYLLDQKALGKLTVVSIIPIL